MRFLVLMAYARSEDSDELAHLWSLTKAFAILVHKVLIDIEEGSCQNSGF